MQINTLRCDDRATRRRVRFDHIPTLDIVLATLLRRECLTRIKKCVISMDLCFSHIAGISCFLFDYPKTNWFLLMTFVC